MKRTQCTGRNAKGTGPCQATASLGHDTCARCGGRRKPRAAKTLADIAKRPPTNSLGEPWLEGQTWTCTGCGASGPDRDDVRMPASCECIKPMRYAPPEHEAAIRAKDAARLNEPAAESTASAVSPEANRPVAEGPVEVVDASDSLIEEGLCAPCPRCGRDVPDGDGFGVLAHLGPDGCGYCSHPSIYDGACGICGHVTDESPTSPTPVAQLVERPIPNREDAGSEPARRVAREGLHHCDWRSLVDVARALGGVDVLCTDAPYSAETHEGHGTMERWGQATPPSYDGAQRREIDYAAWDEAEVHAFVEAWAPLTRGWFLSLTDENLAPTWKRALRDQGRWCGSLIPCTERGSTVRLCGGGPSSCTTFLVVARPRTPEWLAWVTTESHYVVAREKKPIVGGKALALCGQILSDYSRPGDLVCDPCAGAASFLRMAVRLGRRALGAEPMAEHYEIGARLLSAEVVERTPDVMLMRKQPALLAPEHMRRRTA